MESTLRGKQKTGVAGSRHHSSTSGGALSGERCQATIGVSQTCPARMSSAAAAAPPLTQNDRRHSVRARNTPKAKHNGGNAGRMYVGNLLPASEKKNTHHPPPSKR